MMSVLPGKSVVIRRFSRQRKLVTFVAGTGIAALGLLPVGITYTAEAAFPGRNGRIVFAVLKEPAEQLVRWDADLFTVSPTGAGIRQLTSGPETDLWPAWSPDGTRIAFSRSLTIQTASDLYVMDAVGGDIRQLTNTPDLDDWGAAWSPDGTQIVFAASRYTYAFQSEYHLYIMNSDGSDVRQLTYEGSAQPLQSTGQVTPAWSPDGRWIAYAEYGRGHGLVSPDGTRRRRLPRCDDGAPGAPAWSPDGKKLVFRSVKESGSGEPTSSDVWVTNIDGTGCSNLTASEGTFDEAPTWSPDGKWIAFISDRAGSPGLYKMHVDGSHIVRLVAIELTPPGLRPDWGPRP